MSPGIKFLKKPKTGRILVFSVAVCILLHAGACSKKISEAVQPVEELYAKAMALYEGKPNIIGKAFPGSREKSRGTWAEPLYVSRSYTRAIEAFQQVTYYYPFSKYSILSELRIADCHFEIDEFEIAALAYEDFIRFHPAHEDVPYATYRLGLCYHNRMRKPGRDQTDTEKALIQFQILALRYPESEYREQSRPLIKDCEDRLARHNFKIARFYLKQDNYWAAAARFEKVWRSWPETRPAEEALFRHAFCQDRLNRVSDALVLYDHLLSTYPESTFKQQALARKRALEKNRQVEKPGGS